MAVENDRLLYKNDLRSTLCHLKAELSSQARRMPAWASRVRTTGRAIST
jgi:hypothetical protein